MRHEVRSIEKHPTRPLLLLHMHGNGKIDRLFVRQKELIAKRCTCRTALVYSALFGKSRFDAKGAATGAKRAGSAVAGFKPSILKPSIHR